MVKVYRFSPTALQARKVEAMVSRTVSVAGLERVLWPSAAVYGKNRQLAGLTLPLPPGGLSDLHPLRPLLRCGADAHQKPLNWRERVRAAQSLASVFAELHAAGYLMGDVRPEHVLLSESGIAYLVGTDDYQLTLGDQTFAPWPSSAEYVPPEAQAFGAENTARLHTPAEDLFGLAVLLFELLLQRHPYAGLWARGGMPGPAEAIKQGLFVDMQPPKPGFRATPDSLPFAALTPELQALFQRAFTTTERPEAQEWEAALGAMERELEVCEQAGHWRVPGQPCAECSATKHDPLTGVSKDDLTVRVQRLWSEVARVGVPSSPSALPITEAPPLPPLPLDLPERSDGKGAGPRGGWAAGLLGRFVPSPSQPQGESPELRQRRQEVRQHLSSLIRRQEELGERYAQENAGALFSRQRLELEKRRDELLAQSGGGDLEALYRRWHERQEREFLRAQPLRGAGVPGVGVRELALAVGRGIRTAIEVESERVQGLPELLGRELLAWRRSLEDFFQFDYTQIPRAEVAEMKRYSQQQLEGEYQEFEILVGQFVHFNWNAREKDLSRELGQIERQIEQHRTLLAKLDALDG